MIVLSSLIRLSGCKEERCDDYIIVHIPISGWQPGEEWRSEKDEEKSVSLWNDKAAYMTQSYDMDLNLRTTDKQEHLSSQALSSLLPQILSNTISTADISAHILIFFFFFQRSYGIYGYKETQPISHKVVDHVRWGKQSLKVKLIDIQ